VLSLERDVLSAVQQLRQAPPQALAHHCRPRSHSRRYHSRTHRYCFLFNRPYGSRRVTNKAVWAMRRLRKENLAKREHFDSVSYSPPFVQQHPKMGDVILVSTLANKQLCSGNSEDISRSATSFYASAKKTFNCICPISTCCAHTRLQRRKTVFHYPSLSPTHRSRRCRRQQCPSHNLRIGSTD